MRCAACDTPLNSDDDLELCPDCLSASGAEVRAPIPKDDEDLADYIDNQDDATDPNGDEQDEDTDDASVS